MFIHVSSDDGRLTVCKNEAELSRIKLPDDWSYEIEDEEFKLKLSDLDGMTYAYEILNEIVRRKLSL